MSARSVADAMRAAKPLQSRDRLDLLRQKCLEARNLELEIADLESRLREKKSELSDVIGGGQKRGELVDLFEELQSNSHGVDAVGNLPAFDAKLVPFYSASFPKDPEKARVAVDLVVHGWRMPDLVKNSFTVNLGMGDNKKAEKLAAALGKMRAEYSQKVTIHSGTLKAEIRRRFESGDPLSPTELEMVGGYAGKIVEIKERKAK